MTEILIYLGVFVGGAAVGYLIAAVTETRIERKLDKKFWQMQDDLREVFKK